MRTEASTENPPPCCPAGIARASSPAIRPRRTKLRREAPAHVRRHRGDGLPSEPGGLAQDDALGRRGLEHAIADAAVTVQVGIERGTEAVDAGHRPEAGRGTRTRTVRPQALLHCTQEQAQGGALGRRHRAAESNVVASAPPIPLGDRQAGEDVIGPMRRGGDHAPGVARRAHAAPLAREGDQEVVPAAG